MLQKRLADPSGDRRWHSPDRDIAYCWPFLVRAALDGLAETKWEDWFKGYFAHAGLTETDIGRAGVVYAQFLMHSCDQDCRSPRDVLTKVGWFDLPPAAQAALCLKLGQVMTCAFYTAIRDVTPKGEEPPLDGTRLYSCAIQVQQLLGTSRMLRGPLRLLRWLRTKLWSRTTTPASAA